MIKVNKAKCRKCGDIIESKHVHDYVSCKCGAIAVDGGHYYLKRSYQVPSFTYRTYITKPQRVYEKAKRILNRTDKSNFRELDKEEHLIVTNLNDELIEKTDIIISNSDYFKNKDKYKENEYDRKI